MRTAEHPNLNISASNVGLSVDGSNEMEKSFYHSLIFNENIEIIFCSPLRRSLETILSIKKSYEMSGSEKKKSFPKIIALPYIREALSTYSDKGPLKEELEKEFPQVDFSHLPYFWWFEAYSNNSLKKLKKKEKIHIEPELYIKMRANNFLFFLSYCIREKNIFVVSHDLFLRRIFKEVFQFSEIRRTKEGNITGLINK